PVFLVGKDVRQPVIKRLLRFRWHPGLSRAQKWRCIDALHESALAEMPRLDKVLEVSRSSAEPLGRALSAFNLATHLPGIGRVSVESAYQCAKVFDTGGPFIHLIGQPPDQVRRAMAPHANSRLLGFQLDDRNWPLAPETLFYDWLY